MRVQFSSGKAYVALCSFALASSLFLKEAAAEKILAHDGDWTLFSEGRVGGFVSYVRGDGFPKFDYGYWNNPSTGQSGIGQIHDVKGGGMPDVREQQPTPFTIQPVGTSQGTIERTRIRSGMIGNTFAFGVRGPVTPYTTVKGYIQFWAWVENDGETKSNINIADVRQGYVKLEGLWGSLLVGRTRGLYSRGATDIDVMYAHGYGVGYPGSVDGRGPTQGHVGFGVLGSGFSPAVIYGTPVLGGLQLNIGAYDPLILGGGGSWTRTTWPRAEAELTFEQPIGKLGKVVLFGNGAYQKVNQGGTIKESVTGAGVGYGGRFELGRFHLGVAGHYGIGLGLNYALEVSDAAQDSTSHLRKFDGYYVQGQVALGKVDVSAGWGITRVFLNKVDGDPDPTTGQIPTSWIKHQQGISCGAVYHARPWLHIDVDLFRAEFAWFLGEKQVDYIANSGMMFTW